MGKKSKSKGKDKARKKDRKQAEASPVDTGVPAASGSTPDGVHPERAD